MRIFQYILFFALILTMQTKLHSMNLIRASLKTAGANVKLNATKLTNSPVAGGIVLASGLACNAGIFYYYFNNIANKNNTESESLVDRTIRNYMWIYANRRR